MKMKAFSAASAAIVLSALPLLAGASTGTVASPNGQITTNVSATVVKDCKINEAGPLALDFGSAINLIRGTAPASPSAHFSVTCNNGTAWHLAADANGSAPVDLTASGYSASFSPSSAAYNVKADFLGTTSTSSSASQTVNLAGTFTTADPPIGTYTGSFVISVMI